MKGREIFLGEIAGREAAALVVDGRLADFLIDPLSDAQPAPGAIFRGATDRPLKGQGGMMMKLPDGKSALLRGAKGLKPGQPLLVQVTSFAEAPKAAPVTQRIVFKGKTVIVTPGASGLNISRKITDEEERVRLREALAESNAESSDHGVIVRTSAVDLAGEMIEQEVNELIGLADQVMADVEGAPELLLDAPSAHDLAWREWQAEAVTEGFDGSDILDMLGEFGSDRVEIGSAHLFIEETRAFVAVDVNTGADFSTAAGLKANLAAARDLPRQLRVRSLGGQIVIDPAPMAKKDRRQFESVLKSAFRGDPIETSLVGWTPLGHFELQRKRERLPIDFGFLK